MKASSAAPSMKQVGVLAQIVFALKYGFRFEERSPWAHFTIAGVDMFDAGITLQLDNRQ